MSTDVEPASCEHAELHFMRGFLYVVCATCHARWVAAQVRSDEVDMTRSGAGAGGPDERRRRPA